MLYSQSKSIKSSQMNALPRSLTELRRLISRMPGFSEKGAERFLEWWWRSGNYGGANGKPRNEKEEFFENWGEFIKYKPCKKCYYFAKDELCVFCGDGKRENDKICVVGSAFSAALVDKEAAYNGLYFVLDGDVVGSRNIKTIESVKKRIAFLKTRITEERIAEVIMATDFTSHGEATAFFIEDALKYIPVKVSRLARGLHMGDSLGYSDPVTLRTAFDNRKIYEQ